MSREMVVRFAIAYIGVYAMVIVVGVWTALLYVQFGMYADWYALSWTWLAVYLSHPFFPLLIEAIRVIVSTERLSRREALPTISVT